MTEETHIWDRIEALGEAVPGMSSTNLDKIISRRKLPPKWNHLFVKTGEELGKPITYDELIPLNKTP